MRREIETLLEHFLGSGQADGRVGEVEVWRHERPEFVSFATHGLSDLDLTAVYPQELVCSVEHGQDGAALELVRLALDTVLTNRQALTGGSVIINDEGPMLLRTRITGLLVASHPYLPDESTVAFAADRSVLATIDALIPLTDREVARYQRDGDEALMGDIERTAPPLLDVTRT